jgi:putative transposase
MAGTFSQIYIQYVFAVNGRGCLLQKPWRDEVFKYMAGIIKGKNQKPIIVNGVANHVHVFAGIKPTMTISDLVRDIKNNSSKFINENKFLKGKFSWQQGYGAFSYAHSQLDDVYQYIMTQEEHHRKRSFREEYLDFLQKFEIEYDERYLFDWVE